MTSPTTDRRYGINGGVAIKAPCDLATTANITLSAEQSIDGTTTSESRVFVKNQTTASENGIYRSDSGSWVREKDFDGNRDIVTGTLITVTGGSTNADTMWRVTNTGTITIDSTSLTFERAAVNDSSTVSFLQAGTGAVSRTSQEKMRDVVSVKDFGATGDGVTDDVAAVLLACATGKKVYFPSGTYLFGSTLALTSSHAGCGFILDDATIQKGFNGTLITVTGCADFTVMGSGVIDGVSATYTGKGIVFSGSGSVRPEFGAGVYIKAFADAHIEIGADSAQYFKTYARIITGSSDLAIDITGTDTSAMQRAIYGEIVGYIRLVATTSTFIKPTIINRVEIGSTCSVTIVSGVTWSNNGSAMTIDGTATIITGCRFSGNVTLNSTLTGVFVGNMQTSGTFTNSTVAGNCLVMHHTPSAAYELLGKHTLSTIGQHEVQINSYSSIGDTDSTYTPDATTTTVNFSGNLTADRTLTLSTSGVRAGMEVRVMRSGASTGGPWSVTIGSTGKTLATKEWCKALYNGSAWVIAEHGTGLP